MSLKPQLPIIDLGLIYINGCIPTVANAPLSPQDITITPGQLRDSTNTFDIVVNSPLVVSLAFNGVGGLDTGTVEANHFYPVYVIYDSSQSNNPAGLLSRSATNPVMPSLNGVTYSHFRLIGYIKTDESLNVIGFRVVGTGNDRKNLWDDRISVLSAGTATTFTSVSTSPATPHIMGLTLPAPQSISVGVNCELFDNNLDNELFLGSYRGISSSDYCVGLTAVRAGITQAAQLQLPADWSSALNYRIKYRIGNTGGTVNIFVTSFTYVV